MHLNSRIDYLLGYLFVLQCHGLYPRFIRVNPRLRRIKSARSQNGPDNFFDSGFKICVAARAAVPG